MRLSAYRPTRTFELTVRMERGERTTLSQCSAISVNPSSARREFVGSGTTPLAADKARDSRGTALRPGVEMGRERGAQMTRGSSRQLDNNVFLPSARRVANASAGSSAPIKEPTVGGDAIRERGRCKWTPQHAIDYCPFHPLA